MKIMLGMVVGVLLCAVWPELPRTAQNTIYQLSQGLADRTGPEGVIENIQDVWTKAR